MSFFMAFPTEDGDSESVKGKSFFRKKKRKNSRISFASAIWIIQSLVQIAAAEDSTFCSFLPSNELNALTTCQLSGTPKAIPGQSKKCQCQNGREELTFQWKRTGHLDITCERLTDVSFLTNLNVFTEVNPSGKVKSVRWLCSLEGHSYLDVLTALNFSEINDLIFFGYREPLNLDSNSLILHQNESSQLGIKSITLKGKKLRKLKEDLFNDVYLENHLQKLSITGTNIQTVPRNALSHLKSLKNLTLGGMSIEDGQAFDSLVLLEHLYMIENSIDTFGKISRLLKPLRNLKTLHIGETAIPEFIDSPFATNLQLKSISMDQDGCTVKCSRHFGRGFLGNLSFLEAFTYVPRTDQANVTFDRDFLAGNLNLRRLTIQGSRFLPHHDLRFLKPELGNLTEINLQNNFIQKVDFDQLETFPNLYDLKISGNNFSCSDCETLEAINDLLAANLTSESDLTCFGDAAERKNLTSVYLDNCANGHLNTLTSLPFILTMSVCLIVIISICICCSVRGQGQHFQGQLYEEVDGDFEFDAFVSYAEEDSAFVMEVLKHLRSKGLSLLEHQEHFAVGSNITENIRDAVTRSRVTLIILSKHFLNSSMCDEEYRTARFHNRRVVMIRRLKEGHDFTNEELALHQELNLYTKTCTYLEEADEANAAKFNERLVAALAPKKRSKKVAGNSNSDERAEGVALVIENEVMASAEKKSVFSFLTRIFAFKRRKRQRHETEMSMMSH